MEGVVGSGSGGVPFLPVYLVSLEEAKLIVSREQFKRSSQSKPLGASLRVRE